MIDQRTPVTTNAADAVANREDGVRLEDAARRALEDLKAELSTVDGRRRYMAKVLATRCLQRMPAMLDPIQMARELGRRDIGHELMATAQDHPALFAQMFTEQLARNVQADQEQQARQIARAAQPRNGDDE